MAKPADPQLGLFETDHGAVVQPAEVDPDIAALSEHLPAGLRLGSSSWYFPGWEGIVFGNRVSREAAARHGLHAYARHPLFETVCLDRGYYGPISAETYRDYAAAVDKDFRFVVKAPRDVTMPSLHGAGSDSGAGNPRFLSADLIARKVLPAMFENLGGKEGPLVFQFPPLGARWTREPERFAGRLADFLKALPAGPLYAVELRNRELFTDAYRDALSAADTLHCYSVHPGAPSLEYQREAVGTAPSRPLVLRWNLHAGLAYEHAKRRYDPFDRLVDPDPVTRDAVAELCLEASAAAADAYVIANNKAEGSAPLTLIELAKRIAAHSRT